MNECTIRMPESVRTGLDQGFERFEIEAVKGYIPETLVTFVTDWSERMDKGGIERTRAYVTFDVVVRHDYEDADCDDPMEIVVIKRRFDKRPVENRPTATIPY